MEIEADFKMLFFDKKIVQDAIGKAAAANLSKAGAYVRTAARSSLRRRKKPSAPGSPPSVHAKKGDFASLKSIFFSYDPSTRSVVVGPVKFSSSFLGQGTLPSVHEFGGSAKVKEYEVDGKWVNIVEAAKMKDKQIYNSRLRQASYAARPFMKPALDQTLRDDKIISVWKDSIKR